MDHFNDWVGVQRILTIGELNWSSYLHKIFETIDVAYAALMWECGERCPVSTFWELIGNGDDGGYNTANAD